MPQPLDVFGLGGPARGPAQPAVARPQLRDAIDVAPPHLVERLRQTGLGLERADFLDVHDN
jgi:hypothetical protein